jgi:hypothetical protein
MLSDAAMRAETITKSVMGKFSVHVKHIWVRKHFLVSIGRLIRGYDTLSGTDELHKVQR